MKKLFIIFYSVFIFCSFVERADAWSIVTGDVAASWGTPPVTREGWNKPWISDDVYLKGKKKPANASDETVAIVYMARQIVAKGGYFCATQLRSRNEGSKKTKKVWTQYQEVVGERNCHWFCEPGYFGEGCTQTGVSDCDMTDISKSKLAAGAGYRETGGWDDQSIEAAMDGQAYLGFGVKRDKQDEADTIVIARSWISNGHGIKAKPVTFVAFCGETPSGKSCSGGFSNLAIVESGGNEKTLCMPGWDGPNCTAGKSCQSCNTTEGSVWNNTKQGCECVKEALDLGGGKCLLCPKGQSLSRTKKQCMTCKNTEVWNDSSDSCVTKKNYSMTQMSAEPCLSEFDNDKYRKCLDEISLFNSV